jgi:ribose/xylose/arabinose/galactoside ABC-type transport system permease subunit
MTLLQGVLFVVSGGQPVLNIPNSFVAFANEQPAGVPMPVWIFIAVAILGYFFLTFTRTGRHCYAIGGNKAAGLAAGVKVRRIVIGVFVVNGILVGLVGALEASLYGSPDQTYGTGFELQVITAVIVGGVSFMGGEGGIIRAMLGVALLTVVGGAIVSFGIDANYAYVVNGAILIVAVSVDTIVQRQRDRRQRILGRREAATGHQPPLPVLNAPAPADTTTADIALAAPHALSADQLNELIGLRREVTLLRRERDLLKAAVAGEGDDDDR